MRLIFGLGGLIFGGLVLTLELVGCSRSSELRFGEWHLSIPASGTVSSRSENLALINFGDGQCHLSLLLNDYPPGMNASQISYDMIADASKSHSGNDSHVVSVQPISGKTKYIRATAERTLPNGSVTHFYMDYFLGAKSELTVVYYDCPDASGMASMNNVIDSISESTK